MTKSHRLRISLRAVLILFALVCVLAAVASNDARRQQRAVKWIRDQGGIVVYDESYWDRTSRTIEEKVLLTPKWLRELIGYDYFYSVVSVDLADRNLTDISPLANLPAVIRLDLSSNHISDIRPLEQIEQLDTLKLSDNELRDGDSLYRLGDVRFLTISGNPLDAAFIEEWRAWRRLPPESRGLPPSASVD
ncbi:leucine-rich repeat domain-containing protein [Lacipirellula limnantheis]|uniref:Internalin-A n=1 Tax=Lacipirellula limnantheis TaxID=2528024 RepID=A0A517U1M9_9BACT|nr:leucine-rich repeat domain-containing protein [Lacipirellula limnantheis]QDT74527.1 Internalin-A precursor [Lacipirellula limnantheis]